MDPSDRPDPPLPAFRRRKLPRLGWREWVALPDLGISGIKAKVDSGARTSTLNARRINEVTDPAGTRLVFEIPRPDGGTEACTAPLLGYREIRSSNGFEESRPVIRTRLEVLGTEWDIELTLTRRDRMRFPLLLGREALRNRCLVDPGRSYLAGRRPGSSGAEKA